MNQGLAFPPHRRMYLSAAQVSRKFASRRFLLWHIQILREERTEASSKQSISGFFFECFASWSCTLTLRIVKYKNFTGERR